MKIEIKKILLPIVLLAASASFTLTGQSCSMPKGNTQPDTIVCSEIVGPKNEERKETEFFVVTKNDTSAFSLIVATRENKVGWIEFRMFPTQKYFQYIMVAVMILRLLGYQILEIMSIIYLSIKN